MSANHLPDPEHRLPSPKPPLDPFRDPFVGNATIGDNLREMVEAAIWTALGQKKHKLSIAISGGMVELSGTVDTDRERLDVISATRAIGGIPLVVDRIKVPGAAGAASSDADVQPTQMVCLRRFCAMDEASTSAAIRQAVARLDAFFTDGGTLPSTLVLIYSNAHPGTITLDIGMPCGAPPPLPPDSELRLASIPVEGSGQVTAAAGFDGLMAAWTALGHKPHPAVREHQAFWQRFDAKDFRPWTGHPEAKLYLIQPLGPN